MATNPNIVIVHSVTTYLTPDISNQYGVLKLSARFAIFGNVSPLIWPEQIPVGALVDHGFNGENVARLHAARGFVGGVVWDVGSAVEVPTHPMATICGHYA